MHTCVRACVRTYVRACVYARICMHACMHVRARMYACMHACMHARMHARMHACSCMHACTHAYRQACTHAYKHACIHTNTYMHAYMHTTVCGTYMLQYDELVDPGVFTSVIGGRLIFGTCSSRNSSNTSPSEAEPEQRHLDTVLASPVPHQPQECRRAAWRETSPICCDVYKEAPLARPGWLGVLERSACADDLEHSRAAPNSESHEPAPVAS